MSEPRAVTVFEYAIVREANRLMDESEKRELTEAEWELLDALMPAVERIGKKYEAELRDAETD